MQENIHAKALLECIEPDSVILFWNDRKPENMPYSFRKMNNNFSNWFDDQDQREEITKRFKDELSDGLVTDVYLNRIRKSWKLESYYQDLINWYNEEQINNCKFYIGETAPNEPSRMGRISKKYPSLDKWVSEGRVLSEEEQAAWGEYLFMVNEIEKGRSALKTIQSYCNAALWFIKSSKNIVEKWESEKPETINLQQSLNHNNQSANSERDIEDYEYFLRQFICIATGVENTEGFEDRVRIEKIATLNKLNRSDFGVFNSYMENARQYWEKFRRALRSYLNKEGTGKIVWIDLDQRFLKGINHYLVWYKANREFAALQFPTINPYKDCYDYASDTKKEIEMYFGNKTATNTVVNQKSENKQIKEIHILEEGIISINNVLAPYFDAHDLRFLEDLLRGESIEKPLNFQKNANQLTDVFWRAVKNRGGYIQDTNEKTCDWILKNFRYKNGTEFNRGSVTKDLNGQETRCQKPLLNSETIFPKS